MTRILASAFVALTALTGAASAMATDRADLAEALRTYAPEVSASQLTEQQAALVLSAAHSGDSASDTSALIRSLTQ